jgi:aspartate/methionine/tyrosine aminotransferase
MQSRILGRVLGNLETLRSALGEGSPWRVAGGGGGWTAVVEAPRIHSGEEWALRFLEEAFVLVQPGYFYDFEREAFLAFSLLPAPEEFQQALDRLQRIFRSV